MIHTVGRERGREREREGERERGRERGGGRGRGREREREREREIEGKREKVKDIMYTPSLQGIKEDVKGVWFTSLCGDRQL